MQESADPKSAIDAVRCLYLARILENQGDDGAARRWKDRALKWLGSADSNGRTDQAKDEGGLKTDDS